MGTKDYILYLATVLRVKVWVKQSEVRVKEGAFCCWLEILRWQREIPTLHYHHRHPTHKNNIAVFESVRCSTSWNAIIFFFSFIVQVSQRFSRLPGAISSVHSGLKFVPESWKKCIVQYLSASQWQRKNCWWFNEKSLLSYVHILSYCHAFTHKVLGVPKSIPQLFHLTDKEVSLLYLTHLSHDDLISSNKFCNEKKSGNLILSYTIESGIHSGIPTIWEVNAAGSANIFRSSHFPPDLEGMIDAAATVQIHFN